MTDDTTKNILVVDNDAGIHSLLKRELTKRGYAVTIAESTAEALQAALGGDFDLVLVNVRMADISGIELCERLRLSRPDIPVIVMTAQSSLESAIAAIRVGAYDYVGKPLDLTALALTVERAFKLRALKVEVKRLRKVIASQTDERILGKSRVIREVLELVGRVAQTDATVLVTGPSGTGKELVAEAIHRRSARSGGPFVAVNCAALPENLLESELFGHARGAFTDAKSDRTGLFLRAGGGTLFLDEIGELPLRLQPKLLRALQERTVRPVGKDREVPFDTRLVVATNKDLEVAVESGAFREDLYYRVNVVQIDVPPLRIRGNDVLYLAQHFVEGFSKRYDKEINGLTPAVADRLLAYDWPGNIRELQNAIERAVALTHFEEITVDDLPEKIRRYLDWSEGNEIRSGELLPMAEVERRHIQCVLASVAGNKRQAARILGLDRRTLYRKLERFGITASDQD